MSELLNQYPMTADQQAVFMAAMEAAKVDPHGRVMRDDFNPNGMNNDRADTILIENLCGSLGLFRANSRYVTPEPIAAVVYEHLQQHRNSLHQPTSGNWTEAMSQAAKAAPPGPSRALIAAELYSGGHPGIRMPSPDVMERERVGRTDEARAAYQRFGSAFLIWAAEDFDAKLKAYKENTGLEDADAYVRTIIEGNRLPNAKDFLNRFHFWQRKPTTDHLFLLLCACEDYRFLRHYPAPDRPPHPLPFIINEDGQKEAARAAAAREGWSGWQKIKHGWGKFSTFAKGLAAVLAVLTALVVGIAKFISSAKDLKNAASTQPTTKP